MTKFDENGIKRLFKLNLKNAKTKLGELKFCSDRSPDFRGLSGWVFEQTVQGCLRKELDTLKKEADIKEQVSLGGRAQADLLIKNIAIEIKAGGLFDKDSADRYRKYSGQAKKMGYVYLYITLQESYRPYREAMFKAVGEKNAFFLDRRGDWQRLVKRIEKLL